MTLPLFVGLVEGIFPVMADLVALVTDVFKTIVDSVGDLLSPVADEVKAVFTVAGEGFKKLGQWLREIIKWVRDLLGIQSKEAGPLKGNSLGKGASNVSFTDTTEVWKKAVAAAFAQGKGNDPQLTAVRSTAQDVNAIAKFVTVQGPDFIKAVQVLADVAARTAAAAQGGAAVGNAAAGAVTAGASAEIMKMMSWLGDMRRAGELNRS